jgi:hypothetical protein
MANGYVRRIDPTVLPGTEEAKRIHPCRSTAPMQGVELIALGIVARRELIHRVGTPTSFQKIEELWGQSPNICNEKLRQLVNKNIVFPRDPLNG